MANIKDVARLAGVSIGTVSNVLNNAPSVREEVRRRVLKAVKELGYRPNRVARSLVRGQTQTLAFILPDITNPFFPEMVRGAADKAGQSGYKVFLGNSGHDSANELEYLRDFAARGVDGLILAAANSPAYTPAEKAEIAALGPPLVLVDRDLQGLDRDLAVVDNESCAEAAVSHLLDLGRREVAIILGPLSTMTSQKRLSGARLALERQGLFRPELVVAGAYTLASGSELMADLLRRRVRFDAVFGANDLIAIGALQALLAAGRRVPEDVAVAGFDDLPFSSLIQPPLTTVRQPTYELGATAVGLVLDRLRGQAGELPRRVMLPGQLMIRASTAGAGVEEAR